MLRLVTLLALLSASLVTASSASAQTYTGQLSAGDEQLGSGEFVDEYSVTVQRGDVVRATVTSQAFDTYVIVKSASGEQEEDDDCTENETTRSCAEMAADRTGRMRVLVTSFQPGESGEYQLQIDVGSGDPASTRRDNAQVSALGTDDKTLQSGEYYDDVTVRLADGERRRIEMRSTEFNTYLIATGPGDVRQENDDCTEGDANLSCLDLEGAGDWQILATSFGPGETGPYTLEDGSGHHNSGTSATGRVSDGDVRVETGQLASGDRTLQSGEFSDVFTVVGTGGPLVVDLHSSDFDPYLVVETPGGEQFDNDDYDGARDRSLLVVQTRPGETYEVIVTSYGSGETGSYRLEMRDEDSAIASGIRTEQGQLASGDDQLESGAFYDLYTFSGVPGQRLRADLTSDEFDTYIAIQPPSGDALRDDDGGGRVGHSRIDVDLTEPGEYTVFVTSYSEGETGAYRLALDLTERFGLPVLASAADSPRQRGADRTPAASQSGGATGARVYSSVASVLDLGTTTGGLDERDQRLPTGEYMEVHTFDGQAGESVRVEMTSPDFDTYLIVEAPSGDRLSNDDAGQADTGRSAVEFAVTETGRYRVIATSYRPGETGVYQIRRSQADALVPEPLAYDRIVGLFVGISDYDRMPDLQQTARDAQVARDAMIQAGMAPEDGVLLTDRDATSANVRAAMRRIAAQSDDRTLFVLFYSGHGGQYARADFQRADPDGLDESIELFDEAILDDELDALLADVPAARQLIVLDACFSGGFSKDVISRPGRMGLFSSEEDVVSAVAAKFQAGGYLSRFFADGIAQRAADEDGNGAVTALELSHYLASRFASDVQVADARAMLVSRDTRAEHQKLVVDRGSVGLYETLFQLRP